MNIELTNDADYLLCVLYDAYRQRRKQGMPAFDAKLFGGSPEIQEDCIQNWPTHDIDNAASELEYEGLLDCLFEADELIQSFLTNEAIAYMERRFKHNFDQLLHYIAELRTILLG